MQQEIKVELTGNSKINEVDFDNLTFGRTFSDHMFIAEFKDGDWNNPKVIPFQKLEFSPALVALHYGGAVFEGLKAFRHSNGEVYCFRPEKHAKRMNNSGQRICMPEIPEELFIQGLSKLLNADKEWIPAREGYSMYIRPIMIASDEYLGVAPSNTFHFIIITSPVSSYYSGSIKVKVETEYTRAAEGGTGYIKMGGNYAGSLLPTKKALEEGYTQIIWTDGKEHKYIEEAGTMNVFFEIDGKLITPATSSSILPGITRESIIELAKSWGYEVEERRVSLEEVFEAHKNGTLKSAFGTGTAATITNISTINYTGSDYELPELSDEMFAVKAQEYMVKLKSGQIEDTFGWMTKMTS